MTSMIRSLSDASRRLFAHHCILFLALLLLPSRGIFAQASGALPLYEEAAARSAALIEALMEAESLPGVSVAVMVDGQMAWSQGFGYANIENQTLMTPLTKLRIGSVAKPITAVGMMVLVEEGRLNLDDDVQAYLPDYPEKEHPVTVRHLAGHLAGIRHYKGTEFLSTKYYATVQEGLDIFKEDPLLFEPGTQFSYSSYGWNLISAVMEAAAGQPFLPFMKQRVFSPLSMPNTMAERMDLIIPHRSGYYERGNDGGLVNSPFVDNSYKWAGGGFIATPEDVVRFGDAVVFSPFFKPETRATLFTTQNLSGGRATNYGVGWASGTDDAGRNWIGHGGGSVGGSTQFKVFQDERVVVCVVTNMSRAPLDALDMKIASHFIEARVVR